MIPQAVRVRVTLASGEIAFLNGERFEAVLPGSCEVLMACGVVYKLQPECMEELVEALGTDFWTTDATRQS